MLHIQGENDDSVADLSIKDDEFQYFIDKHKSILLCEGQKPVFESAHMIESSYFMLTPSGYVKTDDGQIIQKHSLDDVLSFGVSTYVNEEQYLRRGGLYEW